MDRLVEILEELGLPFAYDHFAEGNRQSRRFMCYLLSESRNFAADGQVYHKINEVRLEIYTDREGLGLEARVEGMLDAHGIFYNKSEVWIESERLYEVLYSFEWEAL